MIGGELRRRHLAPDRPQRELRLEIRTIPLSCCLLARFLKSQESLAPCPTLRDHVNEVGGRYKISEICLLQYETLLSKGLMSGQILLKSCGAMTSDILFP